VIDQDNCMPLESVYALLAGTTRGAQTNKDGVYFLKNIPYGLYKAKFRVVGYKDFEVVTVIDSPQNQIRIDGSLEEEEIQIN
jgi:hypothetical protein